ncbi:MAG: hypothetical protein HRT82_08680 [Henriciella sp.]|nr:hypothetical protein [Henriciella sp.]
MMLRSTFKAAIVAVSVFGLTACGGSEPFDPAMFDSEVQRLADEGDMYGEIFLVLKERRPRVYGEFRNIAVREFSRGRPVREASYVAGLRMREVFLDEILNLSRSASDDNVKDMIDVIIMTYEHLNEENSADCLRSIEGLPPEKVEKFPAELRKREMQLVVDLLSAPKEMANRRAASDKEVVNWMVNLSSSEPVVADMFTLMNAEKKPRGKDATAVCDGMITVYKRLSYKTAEDRGTLFRGMALMALKQRQLLKNAEASDDANS